MSSASAVNDADPHKSSEADVELSKPEMNANAHAPLSLPPGNLFLHLHLHLHLLLLLNHLLCAHLHFQKFALHQNLVICQPLPLGAHQRGRSSETGRSDSLGESDAPKTKLKTFLWDKFLANPDHSMVRHEIKAVSFHLTVSVFTILIAEIYYIFNEEMMDSLFEYIPGDQGKDDRRKASSSYDQTSQCIQINVTTEEVYDQKHTIKI
ncbi:hypothetical protein H5410_038137 [Solanum commersonii]|uniref:Uncharacterized protein n=1 Tax=Solanum commersonii TaxID=4109 RepID=A0A9J5Y984_SOLCO|nr:hypothetical protein H5410_038137 [Solanum commersonii]